MLKNKAIRKAYKALQPEFAILRTIYDARIHKKMTQVKLARKLGTKQSAISRLETGSYNPTLKYMKRVARAMDKELVISFK